MKAPKDAISQIEYEVALFIRRVESARTSDANIAIIDRSGYILLRQLDENGPTGAKTLADSFQLDASTVSRQTASLESKGFVSRLSDPTDGRASLLEITPLGRNKLSEVKQARLDAYSNLLDDWTTEDCQKFGELLALFNYTCINQKE